MLGEEQEVVTSDPVLPGMNAQVPKSVPAPTPEARADVDPVVRRQVKAMMTQAAVESAACLQGAGSPWMMPEYDKEWNGSLTALANLGKPFSRKQSNDWFEAATKDAKKPGTTGDLAVTTLQIDYLSCLERAFAARHAMRRPRATVHAAQRRIVHGAEGGPLQNVLEYLNYLVRRSKPVRSSKP